MWNQYSFEELMKKVCTGGKHLQVQGCVGLIDMDRCVYAYLKDRYTGAGVRKCTGV